MNSTPELSSLIARCTSVSPDLDTLTTQGLSLPPEQRCELAQRLWLSVEAAIDEEEELFAEIARRDAEMESGTFRTYTHEEVMRGARQGLDG
jgi:putative addiction module component (TIGR02574 family)